MKYVYQLSSAFAEYFRVKYTAKLYSLTVYLNYIMEALICQQNY